MIRRSRLLSSTAVIAAISLSASLTSGCSTFTDNDVAAEVNGSELTIDQFETLTSDLVQVGPIGEYLGSDARSVLDRWISADLLRAALAEDGVTITDAERAEAEQQLSAGTTWNGNSKFTKAFLIDETAAQNLVEIDVQPFTDDQLRELYNSGAQSTGLLCMRVIAAQTAEQTQEVTERLDAGDEFADIADDLLDPTIDPETVPEGGIYLDPETGSDCISAPESILGQFTGPIDEVVGPIDAGNGASLFVLQRPFDEVSESVREVADAVTENQAASARPTAAANLIATVAPTADVKIDSRYGTWDAATAHVVPTR